jgi:hypothetical protein
MMSDDHEVRLAKIEQTQDLMAKAIDKLVTQGEALIRIEERQNDIKESVSRAFHAIEQHDNLIDDIEQEIPKLKEARNWVIGFVSVILLSVVYAVLKGVTL